MRRSGLPTIVSGMPRSHRGVLALVAAVSMIHLKFSAKCLASVDLVEDFSRHSLVAVPVSAQMIVAADQICAMTWKSDWRRRLLALRRLLRLKSLIPAKNATAAPLNRARARS